MSFATHPAKEIAAIARYQLQDHNSPLLCEHDHSNPDLEATWCARGGACLWGSGFLQPRHPAAVCCKGPVNGQPMKSDNKVKFGAALGLIFIAGWFASAVLWNSDSVYY